MSETYLESWEPKTDAMRATMKAAMKDSSLVFQI